MTDKVQINLRLKQEIIDKIEELAKKEKRSRNNLIELIIEKYIEEQK